MLKQAGAIVVGGGIVGASISYSLANMGIDDVVLLDKENIASGSTKHSGGMIRIFHLDSYLSEMASESFRFFLNHPLETGYVQTGTLFLLGEEDLTKAKMEVGKLQEAGQTLRLLSRADGEKRFQIFKWAGISGAVYEENGGYVDPVSTTQFLISRSQELGTMVYEGLSVEEIIVREQQVVGARTQMGIIESPIVIVAAGAWSSQLVKPWEIGTPIRSKAIQVHGFKSIKNSEPLPCFVDNITGLYGRSTARNLSLIGYPTDDWDIDLEIKQSMDSNHGEVTKRVALDRINWMGTGDFVDGRRSFDGYTLDGRGRITSLGGIRGLILASGWSGGGVKLAPSIGQRVAKLIINSGVL